MVVISDIFQEREREHHHVQLHRRLHRGWAARQESQPPEGEKFHEETWPATADVVAAGLQEQEQALLQPGHSGTFSPTFQAR